MTERARRAAQELDRRGWMLDPPDQEPTLDPSCLRCGHQIERKARYCSQCGEKVPHQIRQSSLDDLEAAIAVALQEPTT